MLKFKNERDAKLEREYLAEVVSSSAASLAAKEARMERSRGFWMSSRWARKMKSTMGSLFSDNSTKPSEPKKSAGSSSIGSGQLVNTSSVSRQLAHGGGKNITSLTSAVITGREQQEKPKVQQQQNALYNTDLLVALCRVYGIILSRWGGGGTRDITKTAEQQQKQQQQEQQQQKGSVGGGNKPSSQRLVEKASSVQEPCTRSLLNVLCFSTDIVRTLWGVLQSNSKFISDLKAVAPDDSDVSGCVPLCCLTILPSPSSILNSSSSNNNNSSTLGKLSAPATSNTGACLLFMFVTCLSHVLVVTDDAEIHDMDQPIPLHQIRRLIVLLKRLLLRACVDDVKEGRKHRVVIDNNESSSASSSKLSSSTIRSPQQNYFGMSLLSASTKTMRNLYDRSSRRPLCIPKLWIVEDLMEREIGRCKTHKEYTALLTNPVLMVCPFLVAFKRRLTLFDQIIKTNRILVQGSNSQHNLKPALVVRIMRGRILEDGLTHLNSLGRNLRQRLSVCYLNQGGAIEPGIDAGGLFKEFWTDLSNLAFDVNYALFRATEGAGQSMYPNPSSRAAHGCEHIKLFEFLGRILGKALYEGITIQPQFAHFLLSFLRGDYNFLHMLPDLQCLDPQLYGNLMFLKTYDGDATDLCLSFTVSDNDFGDNKEIPLIPNGLNIEVTNANKHLYIGLVAKHHVCDRVREQSEAFTRGLWEVIDRSWLRLFNEPELQVLISGSSEGKLDIKDLKAHTRYSGGFTILDKHIVRFWNIVSGMSSKQHACLLRFVTSCERSPPLGFATIDPPFTIQRVGISRDSEKLPSASTCFNILKLPTYSSEKVLRENLLYSIESGAGFELT